MAQFLTDTTFAGNITLTPASGHPVIASGTSKDLNINAGSGNIYINNNTTFAGKIITTEVESASTLLLDAAADITIDKLVVEILY